MNDYINHTNQPRTTTIKRRCRWPPTENKTKNMSAEENEDKPVTHHQPETKSNSNSNSNSNNIPPPPPEEEDTVAYDDDYDYDVNEATDDNGLSQTKHASPSSSNSSGAATTDDDDDNSNSNDNNENNKNAKTQGEEKEANLTLAQREEAEQAVAVEHAQLLHSLRANINYAVCLAFLAKFAIHLNIKDCSFATLEQTLTCTRDPPPRKLVDLHVKLLKNLPMGKHVKRDKWPYYLSKFVRRSGLCEKGAQLIEEGAYGATRDIELRVATLKALLEAQFDENVKFRQLVAEQLSAEACALREQPLGRDKDGNAYMLYVDGEYAVRLFSCETAAPTAQGDVAARTWALVSADLETLRAFIETMSAEPLLAKLRTSKRYMQNLAKAEKLLKLEEQQKQLENGVETATSTTTTVKAKEEATIVQMSPVKSECKVEEGESDNSPNFN